MGGDCNNPAAINIRNNKYLNYRNYTRGVEYDDGKDLISLVQYNKNIDFANAMKYLHKLLGLKNLYKVKEEKKKPDDSWFVFSRFVVKRRKCVVNDFDPMSEDILNDFVPYIHIDLFREGIIKRTIKKFGLGYSYRWRRTIFPIRYWLDGTLMGYNARSSIENCSEFGISKYFITPGMRKKLIYMDCGKIIKIFRKQDILLYSRPRNLFLKETAEWIQPAVQLKAMYFHMIRCELYLVSE